MQDTTKVDQAQTNQQVSDAKTEAIDTITNIQANVAKTIRSSGIRFKV